MERVSLCYSRVDAIRAYLLETDEVDFARAELIPRRSPHGSQHSARELRMNGAAVVEVPPLTNSASTDAASNRMLFLTPRRMLFSRLASSDYDEKTSSEIEPAIELHLRRRYFPILLYTGVVYGAFCYGVLVFQALLQAEIQSCVLPVPGRFIYSLHTRDVQQSGPLLVAVYLFLVGLSTLCIRGTFNNLIAFVF